MAGGGVLLRARKTSYLKVSCERYNLTQARDLAKHVVRGLEKPFVDAELALSLNAGHML